MPPAGRTLREIRPCTRNVRPALFLIPPADHDPVCKVVRGTRLGRDRRWTVMRAGRALRITVPAW
jgi:hypothetical protein